MPRAILLLLACLAISPALAAQDDVAARYHEAAAAADHDALVALWRANPGDILGTIDADLERSLAMREAADESDEIDEEGIAALHARALFGARAASEATGNPIFADYASSFVGWTREQQRAFRGGQQAFGRSRQAAAAGDHEAALAAGRECLELAEPLGDWWGMAMGLSAMGGASQALGDHEAALMSFARARQIHHDLGLYGAELGNVQAMVASCMELGRKARAQATAEQGLALARRLEHAPAMEEFGRFVESLRKRGR